MSSQSISVTSSSGGFAMLRATVWPALSLALWMLPLMLGCRSDERQHDSPDVPADAVAERWHFIQVRDSLRISLDTRTILKTGANAFRVWVQQEYAHPQIGNVTTKFMFWRRALTRTDIDCQASRMRIRRAIYFDSAGNSVGELSTQVMEWQEAVPGTLGESIADSVCSYGGGLRLGVSRDTS